LNWTFIFWLQAQLPVAVVCQLAKLALSARHRQTHIARGGIRVKLPEWEGPVLFPEAVIAGQTRR
jgi:hypothetical protein